MEVQGSRGVVFVGAAILAGAVVTGYSAWDLLSRPIPPEWVALLGLTILSGWATLRIPAMPISFSISDTFSIIAALLVGPSAGALTAAADGLVLSCRMQSTRRSLHRVLFNTATPAIATWIAAEVFFSLAGSHPRLDGLGDALRLMSLLALFGVLDFGVNTGMVALAISVERRAPILSVWREHLASLWVTYLGGVFAAMLIMLLPHASTLEALILIAPLPVILYVTFRHALGRAEDEIHHLAKVNRVYVAAIEGLAQAIDTKDQVTHDHIRRVQTHTVQLARALGIDDEMQIQAIKAAALLHDVGKLGVPEHILNKPGRLTASEFEIVKRHAPSGADILSVIGFPYPVVPIVRHHHENWDGTGYPDGLAGEQIPIGARILAVVDCFDALTSDRPYRPRLEDLEALQILADRRGSMYDARVVDAFVELHAAAALLPETEPSAQQPTSTATAGARSEPAPALGDDSHSRLDLEAFYDLGRALADPASGPQIGELLWRHLHRHLPASAFVLFLCDEATDSLVACYQTRGSPIEADARIPLGDRLSGWVAVSRQAMLNSDARLDIDPEWRDDSPLTSALAVPVFSGDRTVGVLTFYADQPDAFTETHRRLAEAAAYALAQSAPRLADFALVSR